jgi:predicted ABC-type ATPase
MTDWRLDRPARRWLLPGERAKFDETKHPRRPNGQFGPKGIPDGVPGVTGGTGGETPAQLLARITAKPGHDTQKEYVARRGPGGAPVYKRGRAELHDRIRNKFLFGAKPVDDPPRVMFTAGGPASGKSSIASLIDPPQGAVDLDADKVKAELPEYQEATRKGRTDNAALVHEESSDLVKDLQHHASERGLNAIVDGVGNGGPGKLAGKLDQWNARGYQVDLKVVTLPTDVAVERSRARAARSGRVVPENVIREGHAGVSKNWAAVVSRDFVDVELYDNDVPRGADARLIARKRRGTTNVEVLDRDAFAAFLAKAKET